MLRTQEFLNALRAVVRVCPARTTMPILKTVLLESHGDKLHITGDNTETRMTYIVSYDGPEIRACPIASDLEKVVATIKEDALKIKHDKAKNIVKMTFGRHRFSFRCLPDEEFPTTSIEPICEFNIDGLILADVLNKSAIACSNDKSRPSLTGISFRSDGSVLSVSSADGFRASYTQMLLGLPEFNVIVPNENLMQLSKSLEGKTHVSISNTRMQIIGRDFNFSSQLINGEFPPMDVIVSKVIPTISIEVERQDLIHAFRRASVFAVGNQNIVSLELEGDQITIISRNAESGSGNTVMDVISHSGGNIKIALNSVFMQDVAKALRDKTITLHFSIPEKPIMIKSPGTETFCHIIMPMDLRKQQ